MTKGINL